MTLQHLSPAGSCVQPWFAGFTGQLPMPEPLQGLLRVFDGLPVPAEALRLAMTCTEDHQPIDLGFVQARRGWQ